jgi:hypothetical protein
MDAPSLLDWVRGEEVEPLGSNVNRWLRLIDVASQKSVHGRSADERATFREVALLAIERAQQARAVSTFESTRRKLRLRARYMRTGNFDSTWLEEEASAIFELASDSLPIDRSSASRLVELRRNRDSWLATDPGAQVAGTGNRAREADQSYSLLSRFPRSGGDPALGGPNVGI